MTPKGNTRTHNIPLHRVPNILADPDSDPSLSDASLSDSEDSSDNDYSEKRRRTDRNENKFWSTKHFNEPIKKCANITDKLLTAMYKSKAIKFKLDEDTLQRQNLFLIFH